MDDDDDNNKTVTKDTRAPQREEMMDELANGSTLSLADGCC
jgi:hypothetical protein